MLNIIDHSTYHTPDGDQLDNHQGDSPGPVCPRSPWFVAEPIFQAWLWDSDSSDLRNYHVFSTRAPLGPYHQAVLSIPRLPLQPHLPLHQQTLLADTQTVKGPACLQEEMNRTEAVLDWTVLDWAVFGNELR